MTIHRRAIEQTEQSAHLLVEFLCGVLPFLDGLLIGISEVVTVVGVGLTHRQSVSPCAKLEVETILHSLIGIVTTTPV